MNSSTLAFLQSIGAILDTSDNHTFADEPIELDSLAAQNVITPLSQYSVLEVRGPEAEKFLQGQLTCSSAEVTSTLSAPGAHCTVKGRVVASFQLLRPASDLFWLRLRSDLLDITQRALGKYIVFSKAKLASADTLIGIGLSGATIASLLREQIGELPARQHGTVSHGDGLLLQCDTAGTRYEFWGPAAAVEQLWSHCAPHSVAVGERYWRLQQIRSGTADISAATSEMFLPHMLNYHETGAINFKKGCYTGQEIIARTHYRGQVKRHLLRATVVGPTPAAGSDITDANGKAVGNVIDSVAIGSNTAELLAVAADESTNSSTLLHSGSVELHALPLPYAIP